MQGASSTSSAPVSSSGESVSGRVISRTISGTTRKFTPSSVSRKRPSRNAAPIPRSGIPWKVTSSSAAIAGSTASSSSGAAVGSERSESHARRRWPAGRARPDAAPPDSRYRSGGGATHRAFMGPDGSAWTQRTFGTARDNMTSTTRVGGDEGAHMGFIQAFKGAVGGTFADQWKDFLTVPNGLPQTAALFPAVPQGTNAGRGSNTRGSQNVITNGSKILVPQGYGLITVVDGRATGLITEAGGYEFNDQSPDARSVFAGDDILASTVGTSWERFKFGGRPSYAAARVLREPQGDPGQQVRHRVGDLLGRCLPQHPGRRSVPRLLHAADHRPAAVGPQLRARHLHLRERPGVQLLPTSTAMPLDGQLFQEVVGSLPPRPLLPLHERSRQGQPDLQDPGRLGGLRPVALGCGRGGLSLVQTIAGSRS